MNKWKMSSPMYLPMRCFADRIGASPDQMLLKKLEKTRKEISAEVCRRDPLLETYETLKTAERTRREMLEDPQLQRVLGFLDFLHEHSVGAWTSASDGRVFFVAYDRAAVNFGRAWKTGPHISQRRCLKMHFLKILPHVRAQRILLNFRLPAPLRFSKRLFAKNASMTAPFFRRPSPAY